MGWIGVITNAGDSLLARWLTGSHTLTIDGATVGKGQIPEANMRRAVALNEEVTSASIIGYETVETTDEAGNISSGTKFKIQVGPATTAIGSYTCREIGIWAHLDEESPVLLALHQNSDGVRIPLVTVSPNFAFGLHCVHAISNAEGDLNIVIDGGAYVTQSQLAAAREADDRGFYFDEYGYLCQKINSDDE